MFDLLPPPTSGSVQLEWPQQVRGVLKVGPTWESIEGTSQYEIIKTTTISDKGEISTIIILSSQSLPRSLIQMNVDVK